jgi:moderate conductance mechanosensitive channel
MRTQPAIRRLLVAALFACIAGGPVLAQSRSPETPVVTQKMVNDFVDAISDAVVEKLKKEGAAATKPAGPTAPDSDPYTVVADRVMAFSAKAKAALGGYPELKRSLARLPAILDKSPSGGRGLGTFIAILCVAVGVALGCESVTRAAFAGTRRRLADHLSATTDFWPLLVLACLDALGVAAVWLVGYGFLGIWFTGTDEQARLAAGVVSVVAFWRLYMSLFRIFFRPELSAARLVKLGDADATAVYRRFTVVIGLILALRVVLRILTAISTPPEALSAWQVSTSFIAFGVLVWTARSLREPVAAWLGSLINPTRAGQLKLAIARNWFLVAVPVFVVFWMAQIYGAVTENFIVPAGLILTLSLLIALVLFETLLDFVATRLSIRAAGSARVKPRAGDVVLRCIRVAVYLGFIITVAETWIADILGLVDGSQWRSLAHAALTAGAVLFLSYVCWEVIHFLTDSYIARNTPSAPGAVVEDGASPPSATRLATILPLLRMAAITVVFVVATLVVLSELGINITPLIAAVSVLGLAVSFGSQSLVRDIVSGIFFLADDAFRVGEYIDCVKAKGTVEGFTLRSIKLRHQNGQIYTVPFGQLGQVTNFSRDWSTVKFNLRFARETDVEKLRKVVKKVGLEMMEEPEFKNELLEPLKLQGVADVADNALIMRFKFTCKPNIPTVIQRDAMKRLFVAFQTAGIEFASATVSVQTIGGQVATQAAAGAAASAALAQSGAIRS